MSVFWRRCRTTFRWCRFTLWAVLLLLLFAFGWVNLIGVPGFVKNRIAATLRERGVQLEFSRMRFRPAHGLIVENVRIGQDLGGELQPVLTAGEVQIVLDYHALLHRRFELNGIVVRRGKFVLPVSPTNSLSIFNIQSDITFPARDTWSLNDLQGDFAGAQLRLSGQMAHASEIAHWKIVSGRQPAERGLLAQPLKDFADQLTRVHFTGTPQLGLTVIGDADDIHSVKVRLNVRVPAVHSPWCTATNLELATNLTAPADVPVSSDPALDFWTNALPFRLAWITRVADLEAHDISAKTVRCRGLWSGGDLELQQLSAVFDTGKFSASASLNVLTRRVSFTYGSDFDPHMFAPLVPDKTRHLFNEITWTGGSPQLHATGQATLPPWTNGLPRLPDDLLPTLSLNGDLAFSNTVVHSSSLDFAQTRFSFNNSIFTLTGLRIAQDRSKLAVDGQYDTLTKNFAVAVRGTLDIRTVRPLVADTKAAPAFKLIQLTEPLALNLHAAGNLNSLDLTTAAGHLSLTNFAIRGQTIESIDTDVLCSNRVLSFLHPQAFRSLGTQTITADSVTLDFNAHMLYFTNGYSTAEQMIIPRAIGPKTAEVVEPYQYLSPPTARIHGQFPLRDINTGRDLDGTDLTFDVIRGAPFRWSRLVSTNLTGTIHWMGQTMTLTNVVSGCYDGLAQGGASFDFRPTNYGCNFSFHVEATNLDVHALAVGLTGSKTNQLEGRLSGSVVITSGNSDTWKSWFGYGSATLRDGLLWNIPLFGFMSPIMNTFVPGIGNSRATQASLDFFMTNGVARTSSCVITTPTMQLDYSGTVDLQQNVNAHVTARLMRNTWAGPVVSTILWPVSKIFECRVTGQVSDPKVTPIMFPFSKYLLSPVHSVESIFTSSNNTSTNTPATQSPTNK